MDVDHVVPLRYAHEHGGAGWSPLLKKAFANDPANMVAIESGENREKGWSGPAEYMPPNEGYHCEYARQWRHLARKYELEIPEADSTAIDNVLEECA